MIEILLKFKVLISFILLYYDQQLGGRMSTNLYYFLHPYYHYKNFELSPRFFMIRIRTALYFETLFYLSWDFYSYLT